MCTEAQGIPEAAPSAIPTEELRRMAEETRALHARLAALESNPGRHHSGLERLEQFASPSSSALAHDCQTSCYAAKTSESEKSQTCNNM
eukprot:2655507-Amphidinium_carterae.1